MAIKTEARKPLFAVVGAGDMAVENIKELPTQLVTRIVTIPGKAFATYGGLVERGEKLVRSIRSSSATEQAGAQLKTAKSQVKAAATSATKAAKATAKAADSAAEKIG